MAADEIAVLRDALSAHRAVLMGALSSNHDVDIDRAFLIHAGISRILLRWDDFTAHQQREIISTVEYVVNTEDDENDLRSPDGFLDDLERLHTLQNLLGYP